jgi:hypothetical protein
VLKVLEGNPTYTVDIDGYTDASGSKMANKQLSWRREEVVCRHLTEKAPVIHPSPLSGSVRRTQTAPGRMPWIGRSPSLFTTLIDTPGASFQEERL